VSSRGEEVEGPQELIRFHTIVEAVNKRGEPRFASRAFVKGRAISCGAIHSIGFSSDRRVVLARGVVRFWSANRR